MSYPIISVIIECKNAGMLSEEALDSVLMQSFPHWEAFVVCSKHDKVSSTLALEYSKKDPRIHCITAEQEGDVLKPHNLLSHTNGEWITFLSPHDCLMREAFASFIEDSYSYPAMYAFSCNFVNKQEQSHTTLLKNTFTVPSHDYAFFDEDLSAPMYSISPINFFYTKPLLETGLFLHRSILENTKWKPFLEDAMYRYDFMLHYATQYPIIYLEKQIFYNYPQEAREQKDLKNSFKESVLCTKLLCNNSISDLLASQELHSFEECSATLDFMLSVAFTPTSLVYNCGQHTLFVERIAEWLCSLRETAFFSGLLEQMRVMLQHLMQNTSNLLCASANLLLSLNSESSYFATPEKLSIILARSGGQLLKTNPSTAMVYLGFYKELFPSIYSEMLSYFHDEYPPLKPLKQNDEGIFYNSSEALVSESLSDQ